MRPVRNLVVPLTRITCCIPNPNIAAFLCSCAPSLLVSLPAPSPGTYYLSFCADHVWAPGAQPSTGEKTISPKLTLIVCIAVNRIAPRVVVSKVANFSSAVDKLDTPGSSKDVDPKIVSIVDQISGLTLLQTADLVSLLKVYIL